MPQGGGRPGRVRAAAARWRSPRRCRAAPNGSDRSDPPAGPATSRRARRGPEPRTHRAVVGITPATHVATVDEGTGTVEVGGRFTCPRGDIAREPPHPEAGPSGPSALRRSCAGMTGRPIASTICASASATSITGIAGMVSNRVSGFTVPSITAPIIGSSSCTTVFEPSLRSVSPGERPDALGRRSDHVRPGTPVPQNLVPAGKFGGGGKRERAVH